MPSDDMERARKLFGQLYGIVMTLERTDSMRKANREEELAHRLVVDVIEAVRREERERARTLREALQAVEVMLRGIPDPAAFDALNIVRGAMTEDD